MSQVAFIVSNRQKQTRREYELQLAEAKSHAARVSFSRRRDTEINNLFAVERRQAHKPVATPSPIAPTHQSLSRFIPPIRLVPAPSNTDHDHFPFTDQFERSSQESVNNTAWQWIHGTCRDPFNVIPGADSGAAPQGLEFRKIPACFLRPCTCLLTSTQSLNAWHQKSPQSIIALALPTSMVDGCLNIWPPRRPYSMWSLLR